MPPSHDESPGQHWHPGFAGSPVRTGSAVIIQRCAERGRRTDSVPIDLIGSVWQCLASTVTPGADVEPPTVTVRKRCAGLMLTLTFDHARFALRRPLPVAAATLL